jgi:hypothetical protein
MTSAKDAHEAKSELFDGRDSIAPPTTMMKFLICYSKSVSRLSFSAARNDISTEPPASALAWCARHEHARANDGAA